MPSLVWTELGRCTLGVTLRGCDPRVAPGDGHGVLDEAVTYAAPLQAAEDRALCPSAAPLGRLSARHPDKEATRTNLIPNAGSDAGRARFSGQLSCSTRCRERPAVRHAAMRRCASFRSALSCRRASDSVRAMAMPRRIELQPPHPLVGHAGWICTRCVRNERASYFAADASVPLATKSCLMSHSRSGP